MTNGNEGVGRAPAPRARRIDHLLAEQIRPLHVEGSDEIFVRVDPGSQLQAHELVAEPVGEEGDATACVADDGGARQDVGCVAKLDPLRNAGGTAIGVKRD